MTESTNVRTESRSWRTRGMSDVETFQALIEVIRRMAGIVDRLYLTLCQHLTVEEMSSVGTEDIKSVSDLIRNTLGEDGYEKGESHGK